MSRADTICQCTDFCFHELFISRVLFFHDTLIDFDNWELLTVKLTNMRSELWHVTFVSGIEMLARLVNLLRHSFSILRQNKQLVNDTVCTVQVWRPPCYCRCMQTAAQMFQWAICQRHFPVCCMQINCLYTCIYLWK